MQLQEPVSVWYAARPEMYIRCSYIHVVGEASADVEPPDRVLLGLSRILVGTGKEWAMPLGIWPLFNDRSDNPALSLASAESSLLFHANTYMVCSCIDDM